MATKAAFARLKREFLAIKKAPPPYIVATPKENDILEWHYVITGPPGTPYEGGLYWGKLKFPADYPFKPPSIYMITPSGRFKPNTRLCLSMSDFHPGTWNPAWSVASILTGLLSFMLEETPTTGSMEASAVARRLLAARSHEFNLQSKQFQELFSDVCDDLAGGKIPPVVLGGVGGDAHPPRAAPAPAAAPAADAADGAPANGVVRNGAPPAADAGGAGQLPPLSTTAAVLAVVLVIAWIAFA